jgi:ParB family chromosome partitioning protein
MSAAIESLPVDLVDGSPFQPRRRFDDEALAELAQSIRRHGILQPILVRRCGERFELIAGERRLRAARLAGVREIPAVVRDCSDERAFEAALVENLQREEINSVDAALAYRRLAAEFGYTQAEIAHRTGKSRAAVANCLRLLQLPPAVLDLVEDGALTEGHARALLGLLDPALQEELARWAVRNASPVRELEERVRRLRDGSSDAGRKPSTLRAAPDAQVEALEKCLRERFGTRARVEYQSGRGTIALEYYDDEDLCRILELMGVDY